jgi:hypothetical protein
MSPSNTRTKRKASPDLVARTQKVRKTIDNVDDNLTDKENLDPNVLDGFGTWLEDNPEYFARATDIEPGREILEIEFVAFQDQDDSPTNTLPRHHDDSSTANALTLRDEILTTTNCLACQHQEGNLVQTLPVQLSATSGIEVLSPIDLTNIMAAQPQEQKGTISSPNEVDAAPDDVLQKTKDYLKFMEFIDLVNIFCLKEGMGERRFRNPPHSLRKSRLTLFEDRDEIDYFAPEARAL